MPGILHAVVALSAPVGVIINDSGAGSVFAPGYTAFAINTTVPNGRLITHIGFKLASATSLVPFKIGKRNSAGNFDIVYSQATSHPGGGFADFKLTTPYQIPGSGSYYLGIYNGTAGNLDTVTASISRAYKLTDIAVSTGNSGFAEDSGGAPAMRYIYLA